MYSQFMLLFLLMTVHTTSGADYLDITRVRLVDGNGTFSGRVEIKVDGVWGTICDYDFDMNDAKAICRTLNLTATSFFTGAYYGQGKGPVFAQRFYCNGYESHLRDCRFQPNGFCSHSRDIGVICTECGEIDIKNGIIESISSNGSVLTTSCVTDYQTNMHTSICQTNGTWSNDIRCATSGYPLNITDIRLVNGIGLTDGIVELKVNGTWGQICRNGFYSSDTRVVCKMLGFNYWIHDTWASFGSTSNPYHLDKVECVGTEDHINDCLYDVRQTCSSSYPIGVECSYPYNITEVRLVEGTGPYDGRVEVKIKDDWGTVCSRYSYNSYTSSNAADTLCKSMALKLTHYFTRSSIYGQGTGYIYAGYLGCTATSNHTSQCNVLPPRKQFCSHYYDLALVCTRCGEITIQHGSFESFNGTELTAKCNVGYQPDKITFDCLANGTWVQNDKCSSKYSYPLEISDLKLVNNYGHHEGRVEIQVDDIWGTICSNNFTMAEANVICRMIGLEPSQMYTDTRGDGPVFISNLQCNGSESHINNCSYDVDTDCLYTQSAGVYCTGYQLNVTGWRLAGTNGPYHGRVELEVNDTWGTICSRGYGGWSIAVICNMFGLRYYTYYYNARYGQGEGPIYIESLYCSSRYYTDINDCKYVANNYYGACSHANDLSVMCFGPFLNITDVRLINGTGLNDGRAEIKVNDTWGTICDSNFALRDAEVFCSMLGLKAVRFFTGALYGEGSGPVYIDQLFCDSDDVVLDDCQYLFLNECSHSRDVSIVCNECGEPDNSHWDTGYFTYNGSTLFADCSYYKTYLGILKMTCDNNTQTWQTEGECQEYVYPLDITEIKLSGGNSTSNGRVEIKSIDTWGTVCDHGFGKNEADTICTMIGFPPAVSFHHGAYFGEGSGPIFVDDLQCEDNATHINNCSYVTYDNCYHFNDVSVVCTECPSPKPTNGSINSTSTHYLAAVTVTCDDGYNLIGDSEIRCELDATWSSSSTCKLIDCGDPTPDFGSSNTTSTTNGTVAMVSCDEGHELQGENVIICQPSEEWTDNPSCIIKDCGIPNPVNAEATLSGNKTTYAETAVVSCYDGYQPGGSYLVSCLANGTWETLPECTIVDCGDPAPSKGKSNVTLFTYSTLAKIECEPGFNISGDSMITCQADGTWSDNPVCDTSDCGVLAVPNGEVDDSLGTTIGSNVSVTCNLGYKLIGPRQITCTQKGWNETVACEIEDCGNLSLANGEVVFKSQSTLFGDIVDVSCDTGYNLNSSNLITCLSNGQWSETPYCNIVYCNDLGQPNNGTMNATNGTTFNSRVRFRCNTDFLLVGSETIVCKSDGKWSGDTPHCVAKSPNGGHCTSSEYCLLEGSVCENSVCVCKTDIFDTISNKCDIMPLLPYGSNAADIQLKTTDDCGPRITFNPGIPVFEKNHKSLYVCSHGIVSFDNAYIGKHPAKKDKILSDLEGQVVLAPFHAQFRLKQSGGVYFRTYDILKSYSNIETDESVKYIDKIIKRFGEMDNFKSRFALIATWNKVKPQRRQFDRENTSTFQLVLATDGSHTFTFYIYGHDQIHWTTSRSKPRVWIGYSFSSSNVFTHPFAYTKDMFTLLDARESVALSKSGVSGIVFKQLYKNENIRPNNAIDCINWYNENKDQKRYFDYIASLTPECPCDIRLSRFDPWFWQIGLQRNRKDKSHYCVDMLHRGNFGHFGKSCCYDLQTWLWVYQRPIAGGFQLYHPKIQKEHFKHDHEPKENCCMKSNYCNLYYSLRPTGSCYRISPYRFGTFWGDPHFATLDGLNFTFNGIGEFVLLHVSTENITFDLQARTDRTLKKDGNLTDATAFTAFAARDNTNASVHVELNKARNGLIISANQVDVTNQYNASSNKDLDDPFTYSTPEANLILARRDNALSVLFPSSGISLNISVSVQMLSISTIIPNALNNVTSGLLGNFDGNPYNDLMMPNGTVINANSSERHIFDYGKTWEIDGKKSVFVYRDGKSHEDYQNNSFTPRFLDEIDVDKRAQAEQDCNGAENIECVFDLVFTENKDVANATRILKTEADQDRREINETQPTLTGCESINATLGQKVTCPLSFEDGHDIYFIVNNANAQINKTLSTVEYTQSNTDPVDIQVAVRNSNGRSSTGMVINVLLCTKCSGHGVCSNVMRDDQQQTEYFKYSECICESPYDGPDCENEIDWCSTNPCSLERECITLSASEQLSKGKSYTCADCPEGYVKDMEDSDIDECIDVDECSEKTTHCEHICVNTEGSFECSCYTGYRISTRNTSKCNDINECEEALDNCSHLCVNNPGGFSCQCHDGYELQGDGSTCVADKETGVCDTSSKRKCEYTGGCTLEANGIAKCFCDRGLELDANGVACNDIDECAQNVCPQLCTNNHGNFTCSCFTGYYLNGLTNCEACAATRWGENCEKECFCTGRGAQICDPVKGCLCDPGWEGDTCDEDINECDVANICKDPMKECTNNLGSYLCPCMNGFQEINGTCEDINECASPILHDCMQKCENAFGGYTCGCFEGYVEINETSCADIDECEQRTANCEQNCVNEPGFYNCYCNTGYILNDDRSSCEKVSDLCLQLQNLNCSHHCDVLGVGYACGCRKGFQILSDKETCSDVNECTDADLNLCDKVATCRNTYGSFTCECPTGTKLANDKRTCLVCDDFHFGKECSQMCSCLHGVCDKKTGCVCDSGWIGSNCNIDVDECTAGLLRCSAANTRCVNTAGGAICTCNAGYMNISNQCIDVDECKDSAMNTCDQVCVNNNGSYTCKCQQGFTMLEGSCQDIDECSGINDCDQVCDNTIGNYRCSCHDGYALNLTERKSCSPIHVCTEDNSLTCGDNALCMMQSDEIECRCNKGYVKTNDICVDINECNETPCSHNCINTNGSYTCNCQIGYFLKEDKVTCQVCDLFKYGTNCEDICTCVEENTDSCDPKTGQCYCKNGWTGDECDDDANECMNNDDVCPFNSECFNAPGSFNCKCNIGYLQVASGECKVCDNQHYGENCNSICNCHIENTDSCNHTSGACICKEGWAGETCLVDINECKSDPDPCIDVSHSICENRNGSYECICTTGFRGFENLCSDINECQEDAFDSCEQSCINSIGSFHCGCFNGYFMVNNGCKECSGNTFGDNCTEQCDCVATNTENVQQMCDTVTGNCRCKSNWKGETCAEDVDECEDTTLCNDKNNTICVNTLGWYQCICIKGFQENADGHCVAECPMNTFGENCTEQCNCLSMNAENEEQTCDTVTGKCICKSNWKGDTCVEDVNECEEDPTLCSDKNNTTCVNTQGWYQCDCIKGFNVNADGQCVAECPSNTFGENCTEQCNCLKFNAENEEQTCDTVTGKCICKSTWKGETCAEDVDECEEDQTLCSDKKNTTCVNTHGWYQCDCIKGFKENADGQCVAECPSNTFGENCTEQCNCLAINAENEEHTCDTVTGKCRCKPNWKGETCAEDVDECDEDQTLCSDKINTTCVNTHGWYQCDCIKGFKENADGQCVAECPRNTFGENCTEQCNCLPINAENEEQTCDTVTGKCICKSNWKGETCAEDVDECEEDQTLCSNKYNTTCVNTHGWYQCDCIKGFKENADGQCVAECPSNTFGENCTEQCICLAINAENTEQTCDTVTGKCRCKPNWKGDTCAEDVNECEEDMTLCNDKNNTTCVNTNGWYQCDCINGFKENADGHCVTECFNNTFGENCTKQCDCVATNAENVKQMCDTVTGKCRCKSNWKGDTCVEDVDECEEDTILCSNKNNTTCVNTHGWYQCDCIRGFKENTDGQCVRDSSSSTDIPKVAGVMTFNFSITIHTNSLAGNNLKSANSFDIARGKVEKSLLGFYSRYTAAVIQIFIVDLKIGSIIVDYVVAFDENYSVSSELIRATADLIQGTQIMFDGEMTNATSDGHQNMDQCTLYSVLIGSCDDGYHCEVSNNVPICREYKEDDGLFHIIIVIISTLGGLMLIIGAIIVIICLRKRKQKQKKDGKQRKYFAANMKQKNYGGGNYLRTAKTTNEDINSEGSLNSKVLAWNQKQSGFTDFAGRDVAYNQPLHIPRAHIERSNSFGIHNNDSGNGGTRTNRARNDNGIFKSSHGVTGGRSNRANNDNGVHNDGFESDGFRVKRASANDVINKDFDHTWGRSYRPSYDDKMDREEYFNF